MSSEQRTTGIFARINEHLTAVGTNLGGPFHRVARRTGRWRDLLRRFAENAIRLSRVHDMRSVFRRGFASIRVPVFVRKRVPTIEQLRERVLELLRKQAPAAVVLFVGMVVSLAVFMIVRNYDQAADRQEFDRKAAHYILASNKAVGRYIETISDAGALVAEYDGQLGRWKFFEFAKERLSGFTGIQALVWVPHVEGAERAALEQAARKDGLFSFQITERDAQGNLVKAGARSEFLPIYYAEPFDGNEDILGIDLASQPAYLEALDRARDSGQLSTVYAAPSEARPNAGSTLMVVSPVYTTKEVPQSTEARRRAFAGFAIGLLDVGAIIDTTLTMFTTPDWLDFYLLNEHASAGQRLLYYRPSQLRIDDSAPVAENFIHEGFFTSAAFTLADRRWSIVVKAVPGKLVSGSGIAPWGLGLVCLMLTLTLVVHMTSVRNRQREIERAVTERTGELMQATASNVMLEQEIAHRKRVELELRAAKDQAEVANRTKSEFLTMVSHELRTPLNAVIGFSEMMVYEIFGPVGDKKYQEYGIDIRKSGLHLLSLINNILDLSKIEAKKFELNEVEADIAAIIEDALSLLRDKAKHDGIAIETQIADSFPLINGDARSLKQIFINLLSNAVKFTPEGGHIVVSAKIDYKGRFVASVSDDGIGIAPRDQARIFQPFLQADSSLAREYEGTGLGLPLTKSLVELHGGELKLKSRVGDGTTVKAILPKERVVAREFAAAAE